ncbi:MAG: DUF3046 domain-containing protein [Actinomycetota bacterium]|nr:DUF3046 domain-containing protein [Actinomycetota bacterium]
MRVSEFWRLMDEEFGSGYARVLARSHSIYALADRTADQAIDEGANLRDVWQALCKDMDVPPDRWLGRDLPAPR